MYQLEDVYKVIDLILSYLNKMLRMARLNPGGRCTKLSCKVCREFYDPKSVQYVAYCGPIKVHHPET